METLQKKQLSNYLEFTTSTPGVLIYIPFILLLAFGIFLIIIERYLKAGFLLLTSICWMHSTGVRFQVKENLYKKYYNIAGVKIGFWEKLPANKFILLKKNSNTENVTSIFGDSTERDIYYTIFLKDKKSKFNIPLYANLKLEDAKISAEELAAHFECELITYLK